MMRIIRLLSSAFLVLTLCPVAVYAASEQRAMSMNVGNDRYIFGPSVTISSNVPGDLTAAGGTIAVNSTVLGSMQAVGGNITIGGDVRHNVRIAGGTIDITHIIGGNLVVAGGTVHIEKNAIVGGSVLIAGGNAVIDGTIVGNLQVRGGTLTLNGIVRGDIDAQVQEGQISGEIDRNAVISGLSLSFASDAHIGERLRYWQPGGAIDTGNIAKGGATYDESIAGPQIKARPGSIAAILTAAVLIGLLSAALLIALLLLATKNLFRDAAKYIMNEPGQSFLVGLLYFVLIPLGIVILLLSVIGIPLAIALLLIFITSLLFSKVLAAILLTRIIDMKWRKRWTFWPLFFATLGVYVVLKIVSIIPILGWLVVLLAIVMSYGALAHAKFDRYKKIR